MIDLSLYLVTDRALSSGRSTLAVVEAAVRGGVTCVQLREKSASTRRFVEEAMAVKGFLREAGVPLIVNDRIDVALAVGAEGIHLGQTDMLIRQARPLVGDRMLIGISAESVEDAIAAEAEGADYVSASPLFATPTKTDTAAPLGMEGLRQIRAAVRIPLVAIGGIHRDNCGEVIRSGADGVAVVSAIVSAEDPEAAAREISSRLAEARRSCT